MPTSGLNPRQTLIIAIGAVIAAVLLGAVLFYSDIDAFLTEIGK
jgi:hypothetical protein